LAKNSEKEKGWGEGLLLYSLRLIQLNIKTLTVLTVVSWIKYVVF